MFCAAGFLAAAGAARPPRRLFAGALLPRALLLFEAGAARPQSGVQVRENPGFVVGRASQGKQGGEDAEGGGDDHVVMPLRVDDEHLDQRGK